MMNYLPNRVLLFILIGSMFYLFPTVVHAQDPLTDCPPESDNIWVQLDNPGTKFNATDLDRPLSIPFDTGEVLTNGHTYVNYLLGVLMGEVAPTVDFRPVDDETLRAMAILARTVAYHNCRYFPVEVDQVRHYGMDDNLKQVYNPPIRDRWLNDPNMGKPK